MAAKVISLAIEGEREYLQSISQINSALDALKAQLAQVEDQVLSSADSIEALSAKNDLLLSIQTELQKKLEESRKALERAQAAQQKYMDSASALGAEVASAEKRLDGLKTSTTGLSAEQLLLNEALRRYREAQADAQAYQDASQKGVERWQDTVSSAQKDLERLNVQLADNATRLEEAKKSADKHATAASQYAKQSKEAAREADASAYAIGTLASALKDAGIPEGLEQIKAALQACVDASVSFESAMADVSGSVGGTDAQLKDLSDGIKQMSTEMPASAEEIAALAQTAGQLGIAAEDVLDFSRVMLGLGECTDMSAEEAASAFAKLSAMTGTSASDYERLGSVIVELDNHFAATGQEIIQLAAEFAAAGVQAGLTEPEIMALAAAMASVAAESGTGGAALNEALTAMESAVSSGGAALETFARVSGLSAAEFSAAFQDNAVTAIQAFFSGLGELEKQGQSAARVLEELGLSSADQAGLLTSLATSSNNLSSALALSGQAWKENTALSDEAGIHYETTEGKLAMCENALTNVKAAIGDVLAPALQDAASFGTEAFSWAADFIEQNPWLVEALTGVAAAVGTLVTGVTALGAVNTVLSAIGSSLSVLAGTAMPIVGIVSAFVGLAAAIGTAAATASSAVPSVQELTTAAQASADAMAGAKDRYSDTLAATEAAANVADTYIDKLESMKAAGIQTDEQAKEYHDTLATLCQVVPELASSIDLETDSIKGGTEALRDNVDAWKANAEQQAYQDYYNSLYANYSAVLIEAEKNSIKLSEAQAAADVAAAGMDSSYEKLLATLGMTDEQFRSTYNTVEDIPYRSVSEDVADLRGQYLSFKGQLEDSNASVVSFQSAIEENEEAAANAEAELELAEQALANLSGTAESGGDQIQSLTAAQDTLTAALQEQEDQGQLSAATTQKLIDAGYESALVIDQETGAVHLNKEAFIQAARAKIDERIETLQTKKASVEARIALIEEARAANDAAIAHYNKAKAVRNSKRESRDGLEASVSAYDKEIAALQQSKKSLDSYATASSGAAKTSASTSKKIQTQAEKDLAKFKELRSTLDHALAMGEITEEEYYKALEGYRDQYLTDRGNLSEYRKINEELYKYDQKLAEDEKKLWAEQTGALVSELESRFDAIMDKQSDMAKKLAGYGDLFTVEGDKMSLESIQRQTDAIRDYGDTLRQLKDSGVTGDLLGEITRMDVDDATQYGNLLLGMSEDDLAAYIEAWDEKQTEAKRIAEEFYSDELKTLETEFKDKLDGALDPALLSAFANGQEIDQAIIDGLSDKEAEIYEKVSGIAREMERILSSAAFSADIVDGSHAAGLPYVPFDGYLAQLHQGERVLTKEEAQAYITRSMPKNFSIPASNHQQDVSSLLTQAVNAISMNQGTVASGDLIVEIPVDGEKFYRATIRDFRRVSRANPEVRA